MLYLTFFILNNRTDSIKCLFTLIYVFNSQEDIEVKKDTERADEIRALKKAWEDAEPGRAAKVSQPIFHSFDIS